MDDSAISVEELGQTLAELDGPIYLVGDGAALCHRSLPNLMLKLMPEHLRMQRASGTALLAWEQLQGGDVLPASEVAPNYLRLSQAERERLKKIEME